MGEERGTSLYVAALVTHPVCCCHWRAPHGALATELPRAPSPPRMHARTPQCIDPLIATLMAKSATAELKATSAEKKSQT